MAVRRKGKAKGASGAHGAREAPGEPAADFYVVGIGASAGGLAAFEAFFSAIPPDVPTGMAFVLVQHLAPDHKSILCELLRRYTRMEVLEAQSGMDVRPDHTYIIPPNCDMALLNGTLQLLEPAAPRGHRLPIDFFFRSLAQDRREHAICIVLSGTGSDGVLGVRAVKGEGGMAMAQNPESAEYDSMPRSALETGLVDFVLPPAEMPARLIAYASRAGGVAPGRVPGEPFHDEHALKKIFVMLRSRTGHDFSHYKESTIVRRVRRRMALHQLERIDEYVRYLSREPAEVEALFRELLIGVTSFFRDADAFDALQEQVVPRLLEARPPGSALRVWVPGCSTGEEAYSLAILIAERMESLRKSVDVQVFATDIDRHAIDRARSGAYPASIVADVSPERLARFFVLEPGGAAYRIHKSIRDMLVFSEQDVIRDPPFSRLDLISCRNLLIYMGGELQKRLIPLFHYSLNPGGALFLGTSETIGEFVDLFSAVDRRAKIFRRNDGAHGAGYKTMGRLLPLVPRGGTDALRSGQAPRERGLPLRELVERALVQLYAPAGALVDARGDILYLHGRTGRYLEPAPGEAGMNILRMAREGLRRELAAALHRTAASGEPARCEGLRIGLNGDSDDVTLVVRPMDAAPAGQALFLVAFEEAPARARRRRAAAVDAGGRDGAGAGSVDERLASLQQELRARDEYLRTVVEEMETSSEELKSSNEEMQSVNEELQSTNEELETSKEELQSVNEELATVNAELQQRVAELSRANNDMNNLLAGTGIATLFVDHQLCVMRFTPAVTQVINLIGTDVGRPLSHIRSNLAGYDRLPADVQSVLDTLVPRELEVRTAAGAWFLLRISPYRTLENVIDGAVVTFHDITEVKKAEGAVREADAVRRLAVVVRDANDAVTVQDLQGRILAWNPGAERMYGWSEAEALTMSAGDLIPAGRRRKEAEIVRRLSLAESLAPYRTQRITRDGRVVEVSLTATALMSESGEVYAIATTERERAPAGEERRDGR